MNQASHTRVSRTARRQAEVEDSPARLARHIGKSLLITLGSGILLLLLCSLISYFSSDPNRLILPLGLTVSALTALIGGFAAIRLHGHSALICGLLNGTAFSAVMLLLSLFFGAHATGYPAWVSCLLHVGFLLLSILGGYLGLPKNGTKRKKHPR